MNRLIAALAARQHAVVSLEQLVELGLSVRAVSDRAARGRLHRIYWTVYSIVPRQLLTRHGHWMAAVLACGPGALLSHRAAAALHGLRQSSAMKIDVTVPSRSDRRHSGIALHRSTTLTAADATVVDGIPCTTVARTLFDLAGIGDGEPMIKADLLWRAQRLIVEVDGRTHHGTRQSFERDRRRDQRAAVAGFRVIRTTEAQIKRRPGELRATVAKLLAQAPPAVGGSPVAGAGPAPPPRSTRHVA